MIINYFKNDALSLLESDIPNNIEYYNSNYKWIDQYFESKGVGNYSFNTTLVIPDFDLIKGDSKTDLENSKIVYDALKDVITPVQASDLRLWAYLAHNTYWDYMRVRWPINMPDEDDESGTEKERIIRRIGTRYFFEASTGKAFVRQGISRLFWSAYLTYDENNKNPYEYTEFFLSKQDIFTSATERSLARNKTLLLAALKVLKAHGELKRKQIRQFFLEISQVGGLLMLDSLSENEALELCDSALKEIISSGSQENENKEQIDEVKEEAIVGPKSIVKAKRTNSKESKTIPVWLNVVQTSPGLIGMRLGERFKIRNHQWIITDIKNK